MTDHHTTRRTQVQEALRQKTRSVPNFPAPGVIFEDLTPVLADAEALRLLVDDLAAGVDRAALTIDAGLATVLLEALRGERRAAEAARPPVPEGAPA